MSTIVTQLDEARARHGEAVEKMEDWDAKVQALPEDASDEEIEFFSTGFERAKRETARWASQVDRLEAIANAKRDLGATADDDTPPAGADNPDPERRDGRPERVRVTVREGLTYRQKGPYSFFADLANERTDSQARARLQKHMEEMRVELRDVTTADPGAAGFIPPLYLGSAWIDKERERRPFADACASMPLSPTGKQMDFPRVQTAPTVASQAAEGDAVNETDFDSETYSVTKVTIAGQNDWSLQAWEFSSPGGDEVVMRELVKAYNGELDRQLFAGSGSSGQHRGLRNISGINAITFSSGNGAALVGKIYQAVSDISTNAPGYTGTAVLMHPRRAAWVASHRDTNGSLLQQGELFLAAGSQDRGFAGSIAGLGVLLDANIATNLGTGTNEDEVYVVDLDEIILAEGDLRVRVLTEVLSGTLQVRIQVYAFSAFAGGRRPKVIARISGAGLATPTFPSS